MISVVILTMNEEKDLPRCLDSIAWSNDIHIIDSGSTDETISIAQNRNVNVLKNKFFSFGEQRNFALDNLPLKNDWILFLDADEVVTTKFHLAIIEKATNATDSTAGFYCCWKLMYEDKWLKRCDNFPKWQFRLLRMHKARFTDFGHGQKEDKVQGNIGYIMEPYLHFGFSKGWQHWVTRHNKYSTQEAQARFKSTIPLKNIFVLHASSRNKALKVWFSRMPGWPFLRFSHSYILRLGFLEGMAGFIYCVNMGYYEFLIKIKIRELKREQNRPKQGA